MRCRKQAYLKGYLAEWVACALLCMKGYRVLASRHKTPFGEIDIIAKRGRVVVGVEVKKRRSQVLAQEILAAQGTARMGRALSFYLTHHRQYATHNIRLDGICVGAWFIPRHFQNIGLS